MHAKTIRKLRQVKRNRAKIFGTGQIPRLAVHRSNRYLHVQLIDDTVGKTLVAASTKEAEAKGKMNKTKQAENLGAALAKKAKDAGIQQAVFDRRSYKYHGRVKALAEAARANGLKI